MEMSNGFALFTLSMFTMTFLAGVGTGILLHMTWTGKP